MSSGELPGWDRLRHGGLLLDPQRLSEVAAATPEPLFSLHERELRKRVTALLDDEAADVSSFVSFVLQEVCGFGESNGSWQRGPQLSREWGRPAIGGGRVKPRQLWRESRGGVLPVFLDDEKRLGVGRGRRVTSRVLQWLRAGDERLALITNGRQWRLLFAGLDFDAWCEWDVALWLEAGELSSQVTALRALLQPRLWTPAEEGSPTPLLQAVLDSRKGQAELSQLLGERVREAVELLVRGHGAVLQRQCGDVDPADIYRAAARVVMRMVVVLFAESRELLPRDNALYHGAYGLGGLLEELETVATRSGVRLARSTSAWPRVLALFRLLYEGSHHPDLPVPRYGGELFALGDPDAPDDDLLRALAVFETACFQGEEALSDRDVRDILVRISRTRVKLRQGRASTWVAAPVDFSDLSSEYIGFLYEGLLDFELRTAPEDDAVVFLAVGDQPALPLSRLEAMDDRALRALFAKLRDPGSGAAADEGGGAASQEEAAPDAGAGEEPPAADGADAEKAEDPRRAARVRAEAWAHRAVRVAKLVRTPRGSRTVQKAVDHKVHQLIARVVPPGEWYLVRWGGTRKGSGTFYTRPGLVTPTVQRTLRPLAWDPPAGADGQPDREAPPARWTPKRPEEILALQVVDPACGSGSFPIAALRFLTDTLYASLHHHGRIREQGDRAVRALLNDPSAPQGDGERLGDEFLPSRPGDGDFEPRLRARLRRHVVERCIYGVDRDPLAVELCRVALWVETMDRELPLTFLDHKVKCGNALVGAWFDQFQYYPAMAWKNREAGDRGHTNGVHFAKKARTKAIVAFVKNTLQPDLATHLSQHHWRGLPPAEIHDEARAVLEDLHALPVVDAGERARLYRDRFLGSDPWRQLRAAFDRWCACWFWPADRLDCAPLPSSFATPADETREVTETLTRTQRFFHWELEFPDVFRGKGTGFDAVMGNPPWEIAKPSSKEFFSNIDPLYRSYGKQEALRKQTEYFANEETERSWLDYSAGFRAQSNLLKYVANPCGDPDRAEKPQDHFGLAWGKQNAILHKTWREARADSVGYGDPRHPFRHQGSADINTYKLFLEQAHALLRQGGRLGCLAPSGLYSDHGTAALRELFLEQCRWEWLFGFENREKVFDSDSRFKFNTLIVEKGGRTVAIQTAFMRRQLEDWQNAERLATSYTRERVERFSPRSKAILEIQSARDLAILEKIYANSVLLGDDGPDGWGIRYATEFHMTNDSKLFPPRPRWEARDYRPDEYSRWLRGDWRPIDALWAELGVQPPVNGEQRCAQPPYDRLPLPRAELPAGVVLSRGVDAWLREDAIEDIALPLYEGRMIGQFDFSQKGWVSGKGRQAEWQAIPWSSKELNPQYLMGRESYLASEYSDRTKIGVLAIGSGTNTRSMYCSVIRDLPCGNSVATLRSPVGLKIHVHLIQHMASLAFDYVTRLRLTGLNLNYFVIKEIPIPRRVSQLSGVVTSAGLLFPAQIFAGEWLSLCGTAGWATPWKGLWASREAERLRRSVVADAIVCARSGLSGNDCLWLLKECDWFSPSSRPLDPKGFWRVDKNRDPELRHTVLTLVAFADLEAKIRAAGGDRDAGIAAFLGQNDGEGWMLPETLRLADYDLGHDERARAAQPVASRLGPRHYDWQLAQDPAESWRECHLHARNLLGGAAYGQLLAEIERGDAGPSAPPAPERTRSKAGRRQRRLSERT